MTPPRRDRCAEIQIAQLGGVSLASRTFARARARAHTVGGRLDTKCDAALVLRHGTVMHKPRIPIRIFAGRERIPFRCGARRLDNRDERDRSYTRVHARARARSFGRMRHERCGVKGRLQVYNPRIIYSSRGELTRD